MLSSPNLSAVAPRMAPGHLLAALLAGAVPPLLAYNLPPSATLLNQCVAVSLWGGLVLVLAPGLRLARTGAAMAAIAVVAAAALWSGVAGGLPSALMLSALGLLLAAALLLVAGAQAAAGDEAVPVFAAFAAGLLAAGVLSGIVAVIQAFLPDWADGQWIAHSGLPGRAVGNLRQPNHLCSLLTWGVLAAVALHELRLMARAPLIAAVVLMVFAIELSASRTGALGLVLVAAWGLLDRRLSRTARVLLVGSVVLYGLSYAVMAAYGEWSHQAFGAEARLAAGEGGSAESPNARPRIWANAIALIAQQPWRGVGFGEFNFAWSLTAFPGRPTAFFDHTHTLPLQLGAELGVPAALLVLGLMGLALWQAWRRARQASGDAGTAATAAWMVVLLIGLHSLVEYPLWYAYFLLPAAFAWGFALGVRPAADGAPSPARAAPSMAGRLAGVALVIGGALAVVDYMRVVVIYAPGPDAGPLSQRIAAGQRSVLFAHHADYAAATSEEPLPGTPLAFQRAPHYLLDTRLMVAWAEYLALTGQVDLARTLAQRLREFRNPESAGFFKPCEEGDTQAFQCQAPQAPHDWREFLSVR